jgi:hypothetical protein
VLAGGRERAGVLAEVVAGLLSGVGPAVPAATLAGVVVGTGVRGWAGAVRAEGVPVATRGGRHRAAGPAGPARGVPAGGESTGHLGRGMPTERLRRGVPAGRR